MNKFPILKKPSHLLATLFGIGLLPIAPGTWGSLLGLIMFLYAGVYLSISQELFYFLLLCIISLSLIVCYFATKDLDKNENDQKSIVIDELAGVWLAFTPVAGIIMMKEFLIYSFLAFIFFRIFDIWKPYPINIVDREIKNYFGVVLDDLIAGIYAAIIVILISYLF